MTAAPASVGATPLATRRRSCFLPARPGIVRGDRIELRFVECVPAGRVGEEEGLDVGLDAFEAALGRPGLDTQAQGFGKVDLECGHTRSDYRRYRGRRNHFSVWGRPRLGARLSRGVNGGVNGSQTADPFSRTSPRYRAANGGV